MERHFWQYQPAPPAVTAVSDVAPFVAPEAEVAVPAAVEAPPPPNGRPHSPQFI